MKDRSWFAFSLLLLGASLFSAQGQLIISNGTTEVSFTPATGLFSVIDFASGRTFISQGNFNETTGTAGIVAVTSATFGTGQAIRYLHSDGNSDTITLYTNLPFALFQSTLTNASALTVVSNHIHTLTAQVNLNESVSSLKALGTGGLTTPGGNPKSYAWLAVADPQSRNGVVGAWLTTDRGSGIVLGAVNGSLVQFDAQIDYGRLQFLPGQTNALEIFALGYFNDTRVGLETWASEVARFYNIHLNPQPDGYSTYPSTPNGGASSPSAVAQVGDFALTNLNAFGFSLLQIDSGWQAGITTTNPNTGGSIGAREFLSTNPNGAYAGGMTPTSSHLAGDGITSGLWFSPFGSSATDPYFTNHPDWFIQTTNGTPYWVNFGGACLDDTVPGARNYVSNFVYQIANVWNYKYFKMDALWSGSGTPLKYVNSGYVDDGMGDAVFSDPSKPNIQVFREGLQLVRQAAGPTVYLDGCNIAQNMRSYSGSFGLLDGIRIGPDNGASWGSASGSGSGWLRSAEFGSRHYFLHGRIWYNDPDTVYVRTNFLLSQAQTIASWYGISGQLTLDGDWLPGLPPDRLDLLKRIMPHHGLLPRPVDYFENDPPNIWLLTQPASGNSPRRDVIGLFNWSTSAVLNVSVTLAHLGLDTNTAYVGFDFWSNSIIPNISGSLQIAVQPGSCDIIAVRPLSAVPELVSTSRHVTQGIVDVLAENWNGINTLSGTSALVDGDPYELRLAATNNWQLQSAGVSAADQSAGVTVSSTSQGNGLTRITLNSPTSRQVNWSAVFVGGPSVALVSPTNGQIFYTNSVILLSATASDPFGTISKVDFYNGAAKLGTVSNAPFNLSISNLAVGSYNFSAVATDNLSNSSTSAVVQAQVQVFVPFTVTATPASVTLPPGASTNLTVIVTPTNGFNGTVAFSLTGLPSHASASFNPTSVNGFGSSTLSLTASNGIAPGSYSLNVTGTSGALSNSSAVTLAVNGVANLIWDPVANGVWDVTNTANWYNTGSGVNDVFQTNDNVSFNDSGSAFLNVTIGPGIAVQPASVVVSADVNNYTFSGAGKITGTTGIEKDGAGSLTISTVNDFTGPVNINYGTLIAANSGALGGAPASVTINPGGTLDVDGIVFNTKAVSVSGQGFNGAGAIVNNSGTSQINALGNVTMAGDVTLGGSTRWDIRGGAATLSTSGNPYNITKVGASQVSLVGITVDTALANIDVQQGEFAVQTGTTQVGNATNTITVHSNATLEVWALTKGPLNKIIVMQDGSTFFNESGTSTNAGNITLQGTDTFNIGGTALKCTGTLSGPGGVAKTGASPVYLSAANTYTGPTAVSAGTLILSGSGAISGSTNISVSGGALLDASQRSDATLTVAAGQTLTGNGSVNGNTVLGGGATLAPGGALTTLTFSNNLTLNPGSTTVMEVRKSPVTNDEAQITGNLSYGGTLVITNIGATPYAAGDSFKLFNAAGYSASFTNIVPVIPAVNLAWKTNGLTNGILSIVSSPTLPPGFNRVSASRTNLVFSGTNGVRNWTYYLLGSTNVALPLSNWTILATNAFDAAGNFRITNAINAGAKEQYYLLRLQ